MKDADNRSLYRIDQTITDTFDCAVHCNSKKLYAKILNYNSIGVLLTCPDFFKKGFDKIDRIELRLGKKIICTYQNPKILRSTKAESTFVIEFHRENKPFLNRDLRCHLSDIQKGIFCGSDPMSMNGTTLFFKVKEISQSGFRIVTSRSNRHLTPGLILQDFDLTFPGFGSLKVNAQIANAKTNEGMLEFGCIFVEPSKKLTYVLQKNLILNSNTNEVDLTHLIKKQKNYGEHIRMSLVSSESEYDEVLKLRWRAYKNEGKVGSDSDWSSMKDIYDSRSLIYSVRIGKTLVASIRLIFSKESGDLPFEKYFAFENLEQFKGLSRSDILEISRLAIDPLFQGSDILVTIFRNLIVELVISTKVKYSACTATPDIAKYYKAFGAITASDQIDHPQLKGDYLRLYYFDNENFFMKKMNSFGWIKIARPTIKYLNKFLIPIKYPLGMKYYLRFIVDVTMFAIARQSRKLKRKLRSKKREGNS